MTDLSTITAAELKRSRAACRRLTKATAKNFGWTFRVLPRDQARDMHTLYAFMRRTDDLADRDAPSSERLADLQTWRAAFRDAVAGRAIDDDILPAVGELVRRHKMTAVYFEAVIDGCEQDTRPVRIATQEELDAYCYRVAGAVGLCCQQVWGLRDGLTKEDIATADRLAIRTGFAFQLTNIIRDVQEDLLLGRRYLPAEDLSRFGCRDEDLAAASSPPTGPVRDLIVYEVNRAREAYAESKPLCELVSPSGRRVLTAMRALYGGLLNEITERDYDVFRDRVRLSRRQKLMAVWRGVRAK